MRGGLWASVFVVAAFVSGCGGQSSSRGGSDEDGRSGGASNGGSGNPNGGSGAGGSGDPSGGAGGTGGSAGMENCEQPLESLGVECDFGGALRQHCASSGCHNESFHVAALDLTADDLLISRILDVPARFRDIGVGNFECLPPGCPPLGSTLLVDARSPEQSWMIRKMQPFVPGATDVTDIGCGVDMPWPPGNSGYTEQSKACLIDFFLAVATTGRACDAGGTVLIPPPPPCPVDE